VLIGGEPGAGKTRLAELAAESARAAGMSVAWGTCWDLGAVPAFWPWSQLLRTVAAGSEGTDVLPGTGGADAPIPLADPDLARVEQFQMVLAQLQAQAAQKPLLIVLDDLHQADPPSIRLLSFVAAMLRRLPLAILATYRDVEAVPGTALGDALPELVRHARKLPLAGLDEAETRQLVGVVAGWEPPAGSATAVYRHTGGNPLFTWELVRLLQAQHALERFGRGDLEMVVPEGVRAVLRQRLARLSEGCRATLTVASAIGQEFALEILERLTGTERPALLDRLGEAENAQLVQRAGIGRYAFSHPLMREAVYGELRLARRVRLHQDVGQALEALRGKGTAVDPTELAHHFRLAAPGGSAAKAVRYAQEAAERAMALLAYEDAARLYEDALAALDLAPEAGERSHLLLALADAQLAGGDLPGARQNFEHAATLARQAGNAEQLARAALGVGSGPSGFEVGLFDQGQIQLLEEALSALGDEPSALRAWVLARLSVALSYADTVERRLTLSETAVAAARQSGSEAALAYALAAHCDAIAGPADAERRLAETGEIIRLARGIGDRRMELLGRRLRVVACLEVGDIAGVDTEIEAYAQTAERVRQPLYQWYVPLWRGMRALMNGRLDETELLAAAAVEIGERAHSENATVLAGALRFFALRERGQYREAAELFERVADYMLELGLQGRVTLGLTYAGTARLAEARALLDRTTNDELDAAPRDSEWLPLLVQLAETIAALNGHPMAGQVYELLLPLRSRFAVEGIGCACHGSVERHLGILARGLGRGDAAAEHFEAALEANRRLGAPVLVAHALRESGQTLLDTRRLTEALDLYRQLGLTFWADTTAALLARIDSAPAADATPAQNIFRKEGEFWTLGFAGRMVRLKDAKGLRDLSRLLAQPGQPVHALDLAAESGTAPQATDTGEMIDAESRQAYKARLVELEAELDEADAAGDVGRSARLHDEREALLSQLRSAYGLGGRARRSGSAGERARTAVTWRIRDALGRIAAAHPELGRHLRVSVKTGAFCVYEPEQPPAWQL